jgi:NAD(P)-dependent dehydrogenase (short-subunit alcohol dehydrogenase family)
MRKFNSPTLLTSHSYRFKVREVLESSNKIHPNTDAEFKVFFFFTTSLGTYNLCVLSIQTNQALPGRFTTPDEVAGLASFLVSENAAMITGMLNTTSYKYYQLRGNRQDKV